jgi:hypothetical protein
MNVVTVPKLSGTYADTLRAVGTACLLEELTKKEAVIKDADTHFSIEYDANIEPDAWEPPSPGYYFIWLRSKKEPNPGGMVLNFENEQQIVKAQKVLNSKNRKKNTKKMISKALDDAGLEPMASAHQEYSMAAILASMRMGWSSDKDMYLWVIEHPNEALDWARNVLTANPSVKSPVEVSNSQFYNPSSGKGVHTPKTIAKSPGAISNKLVDSFSEWMKYRGAFSALLPYRNKDDFRIFVIEPREIGPRTLRSLRQELIRLKLWGGIRLDIEASLRLAEQLILHSDAVAHDNPVRIRGKKPAEIVRGLRQSFFQSMKPAVALMNDAFLPLPSWFRIDTREDANDFIEIIHDHIGKYENGKIKGGSLNSLKEDHSDDINILQQYRTWLNTGTLKDFLEFCARFAVHIMDKRTKDSKDKFVKELSTTQLTTLISRGYGMKEIVENPGFLSIARGIRNCTIYAVSLKNRDIQFGLSQQWKQKIKGGTKEFIPALCEFVQNHNWEIEHRLKGKGHVIDKDDLDAVMNLIEKYGVELIGMLLLAYGYARAPKIEGE